MTITQKGQMKKAQITPEKRVELLTQLTAGLLSADISTVRGHQWAEVVGYATEVLNIIIAQECVTDGQADDTSRLGADETLTDHHA
jgi:hypothetical protein